MICVMCVVLWVADEDVSFYEIRVGSRDGMRCVRDMCRRVRVYLGTYIRCSISAVQVYLASM